jgi:ABC-type sugar transport system substrate-binding protein
VKLCHLYINTPDHAFDQGLKDEAERVATELTGTGFPIEVRLRYARGLEGTQLQQIEADHRSAPRRPDLSVIIPVNQDATHKIVSEILTSRDDATCVFLQQPLGALLQQQLDRHRRRLFSVSADQTEIGRIQARQFAAVLPGGGNLLYVQGRENSFATRYRTKGLLEELPRTPNVKLKGYRVYGDWSPASVRPAVDHWSGLGGKLEWIDAAGAQSDDMALALSDLVRERGRAIPVIGVDGMDTGKRGVDNGRLAATVVQPLGVGHALRVFKDLTSGLPSAGLIPADGNILLPPESYPSLDALRTRSVPKA